MCPSTCTLSVAAMVSWKTDAQALGVVDKKANGCGREVRGHPDGDRVLCSIRKRSQFVLR